GFGERRQDDFARVGETRLLAGQRAHTDALLDAVRAVFDDAVFQRPRFFAREREVKIGVIDAIPHDAAEHGRDAIFVKARRVENGSTRYVEGFGTARLLRQVEVEHFTDRTRVR